MNHGARGGWIEVICGVVVGGEAEDDPTMRVGGLESYAARHHACHEAASPSHARTSLLD